MARTAYFGTTHKKYNSTLQPDYTGWSEYNIVFKQGFDVDNPIIILSNYGDAPPAWNQFYLPDTDAWYWITSCKAIANGRWEISGEMDVLATFKAYIMDTQCYIEFGNNTDASGTVYRLQDTRQNVGQVPTVSSASVDITGGNINTKHGAYVLTSVGKSGGVSAYAMGEANIRGLLNSIGETIAAELANASSVEEILKYYSINSLAQQSAVSAIRNCVWMPVSSGVFNGTVSTVYLGDYDSGAQGIKLGSNPIFTRVSQIAIPWPVNDWRRLNCQLLLYLPLIGTVAVPVDPCNNVPSLTITFALECITGGISVKVDAGSYTVYTGSGNIGVPYAIGSSNVPLQNTIAGSVQAVTGAIQAGGGILSAFAGDVGGASAAASGVGSIATGIMQAITRVVQCAGTLGGSAAIGQSMLATLSLLYYPPIDDAGFTALYGHPVMRVAKPIAGYCKTRGFSLSAPAKSVELSKIAALMDTGVFIE